MAGMATAKEKFDAAVNVIQSLPKNGSFQPSYAMMLSFYGLYKQATNGQCNIAKPAFWDVVGKAKWEAWHRLGTMSKERAMMSYVEELKKIIETMPHTENVEGFIGKLGDFYELMDDDIPSQNSPISKMIRNVSPKRHTENESFVNNLQKLSKTGNDILFTESDSSHTLQSSAIVGPVLNRIEIVENIDELTGSSDNEEFCDTSDLTNVADDSSTISLKNEASNIPRDSHFLFQTSSHPATSEEMHLASGRGGHENIRGSLHNEELTILLSRLQQDMNNVMERLQTVETLANQQMNGHSEKFFSNINIPTVIVCLTLPFIVQFLVRLISKRQDRLQQF